MNAYIKRLNDMMNTNHNARTYMALRIFIEYYRKCVARRNGIELLWWLYIEILRAHPLMYAIVNV